MCLTYLAGKIDASPAGPWIGSVASAIEQLECAAYNYCDNAVQTFIEGKDFERIYAGGKNFLKGVVEAFGGAALVVVGGLEVSTGAGIPLGVGKITLGLFGLTTAIADVSQGTQDIEYGWNGDSTTPNSNFIRDSLFGGNDERYGIVSTLVGAIGVYVGFVNYPMLAGTSAGALIPGRGAQGNTWNRNLTYTNQLNINNFSSLKNNGVVQVNSSGSNRPVTSAPNSYYSTGNGEHVFVYDNDGKLIYDISKTRVKGFKINVAPNGIEYYQPYKLKGPVPTAIKNLFGW